MREYETIEEVKEALNKANENKRKYFEQYKKEVLAHDATIKQARDTRFELLLELKGRDDVIDLLNEQMGQMIRRYSKLKKLDKQSNPQVDKHEG